MAEKKIGVRAKLQAEKQSIRADIEALQTRISEARNASRVPERVMNGDVRTVTAWKDSMKGASGIYQANNQVREKCTVDYLNKVKRKLESTLRDLT